MAEQSTGRTVATAYVALALQAKGITAQINKQLKDALKGAGVDKGLSGDIKKGSKEGSRELSRQLSGSVKGIGKTLNKGLKAASKGLKVGAGAVGGSLVAGIGTALSAGFKRMSAIENAQAKIKGLGNSVEVVEQVSKDALSAVKGTAYGIGDASSAAAIALAAGVKEGAELEKYLKTVANLSTLTGSSFGEMGNIMGKIQGSGKLMGDTLNQLQERGFGAAASLSEYFGVSQKKIREMVSAGEVSAEDFIKAMEVYEGAALKSGDTTAGALANMWASFGRLGQTMMGDSFQIIRIFANEMTAAIDGVGDAIAPAMQTINADIRKNLGGGLEGSGERFAAFLMANQQEITTFLIDGYQRFAATIQDMFSMISESGMSPSEGLKTFLSTLSSFSFALNETLATAVPILELIGTTGVMTIMSFITVLTEILWLILPLIEAFADFWNNLSPEMQGVVGSLIAGSIVLGTVGRALLPLFTGVFKTSKGLVGLFAKNADGVTKIGAAWRAVTGTIGTVFNVAKNIVLTLWRIKNVLGAIGIAITGITLIWGIMTGKFDQFIMGAWNGFLGLLSRMKNAVISWVTGVVDFIRNVLKVVGQSIKNVFSAGGVFSANRNVSNSYSSSFSAMGIPAMATGGDVIGPTVLLAGEKDPETIVNRGKMNDLISAITEDLRGREAKSEVSSTVINVHPPQGMDPKQVADMVYRQWEWEGRL